MQFLGEILLWPYSALLSFLRLVDDAIELAGYLYSATDRELNQGGKPETDRGLYEGHIFTLMATRGFDALPAGVGGCRAGAGEVGLSRHFHGCGGRSRIAVVVLFWAGLGAF